MSYAPGVTNSNEDYEVRPAVADDLPRASVLAARLVRMHHDYDPGRFIKGGSRLEEGYERFLRAQLDDADAALFVAVTPDRSVVGYVLGRMEPRNWMELLDAHGKLHDIFVDDEARKHGVGAKLVGAVVEALKSKGAPRVLLTTAWQNDRARRLFESMGFRPTMLEMTLELGAPDARSK